jgi:hypothetical protein
MRSTSFRKLQACGGSEELDLRDFDAHRPDDCERGFGVSHVRQRTSCISSILAIGSTRGILSNGSAGRGASSSLSGAFVRAKQSHQKHFVVFADPKYARSRLIRS